MSELGLAEIVSPNTSERVEGTRMENFAPIAGSVVVLAYDPLGEVAGVSLQARELMADKGGRVRGALVTVKQDQNRSQSSFIDADELPELLNGFDALLAVRSNPTPFKFFEVKYETKGKFQLVAFNNQMGVVVYSVKAGKGIPAQVYNFTPDHMKRLKALFEAAEKKLLSLDA